MVVDRRVDVVALHPGKEPEDRGKEEIEDEERGFDSHGKRGDSEPQETPRRAVRQAAGTGWLRGRKFSLSKQGKGANYPPLRPPSWATSGFRNRGKAAVAQLDRAPDYGSGG